MWRGNSSLSDGRGTEGECRLTFKDKAEFSPYPLGKDKNSRIIEHDLKDSEYYIRGGYDISDIEKIDGVIKVRVIK